MSYLDLSTPILDSKLTNIGRQRISEGNFNISYFQIGDSEFNYSYPQFSGGTNETQRVLTSKDRKTVVKYPYLLTTITGNTSGTTIGNTIMKSETETITNAVGYGGFIGNNIIKTPYEVNNYGNLSDNLITSIDVTKFEIGDFVTISNLNVDGTMITGNTRSFIYKIIDINNNEITLDRPVTTLNNVNSNYLIIKNDFKDVDIYENTNISTTGQQDAWNLNVIWSKKPIGIDNNVGKEIYQYESNVFVSTKEYFGYSSSDGQLTNNSVTIMNSFNELITVLPEEQHSLAILHYSKQGDITTNSDKIFKYDDYICTNDSTFEISIPYLLYERNPDINNNIGAKFYMGVTDKYINSSAIDGWSNTIRYRQLNDVNGITVGKIFIDDEVIVFDDQEIVAALDYNSNRSYTLPIPKINYQPIDTKCGNSESTAPLLNGDTRGYTYYVTYNLVWDADITSLSLPCNHYLKITGLTEDSDLSIKFNENDFKFMKSTMSELKNGYVANKFFIFYQRVLGDNQPLSDEWTVMDYSNELSFNGEGLILPSSLRNTKFIITNNDVSNGDYPYVWEGNDNFGNNQIFPGSVKLSRSSDIKVLKYYVVLPNGEFSTTQNPSYSNGDKYITEVGLLDENLDLLVTSKLSTPLKRLGTQVISVKLDI